MTTIKHILLTLLSLCCLSVGTAWGDTFYVDGSSARITYETLDARGLLVKKISMKSQATLTLPQSVVYKGLSYSIVTIGSDVVENKSLLTGVVIPSGVRTIDTRAFDQCTNMTTLEIPASIGSIGQYAFNGCSRLTKVRMKRRTLCNIYMNTFSGLASGAELIVENGAVNTFKGATGWTRFAWVHDDTEFRTQPKTGCYLYYQTLGIRESYNGVTRESVRLNSIEIASSGATITVPELVSNNSTTYVVTSVASNVVAQKANLSSIYLPCSVYDIKERAFYGCTNLNTVNLHYGMTSSTRYIKQQIIGKEAFRGCSNLYSVDFNDNSQYISEYAFHSCTRLHEIYFSEGLTGIADYAFTGSGLSEDITLPNSLLAIGKYAFGGTNIRNVKPRDPSQSKLALIDEWAFGSCSKLQSVELPNTVLTIGNYAFYGDPELSIVRVHRSSAISITANTFGSIKNTAELIVVNGAASNYTGKTGWKNFYWIHTPNEFRVGDYRFRELTGSYSNGYGTSHYCCELTETVMLTRALCDAVIPNTVTNPHNGHVCWVTSIADRAFQNHGELETVTFNAALTKIGKRAFYGCDELMTVKFAQPSNDKDFTYLSGAMAPLTIDNEAFRGCTALQTVRFGRNLYKIGNAAFYGCNKLTSADLSKEYSTGKALSHLSIIGSGAFRNCTALTGSATMNYANSIGSSAFSGCTKITSVSVDGRYLQTLGDSAFNACPEITSFSLSNGSSCRCTTIPLRCFAGCSKLRQMYFETATTIGQSAFYGCSALSTVYLGKLASLGTSAFEGCTAMTTFVIQKGSTYTAIPSRAFYNVGKNATVTNFCIGKSVKSIAEYAFYDSGIKQFLTPRDNNNFSYDPFPSLTYIGNYAFKNSQLKQFDCLTDNLTSIGQEAFSGCSKLEVFTLSNAATIGNRAFYNCPSLWTFNVRYAGTARQLTSNDVFTSGPGSGTTYPMPGFLVVKDSNATNRNTYKTATGWKTWRHIQYADNNSIFVDGLIYDVDESKREATVIDHNITSNRDLVIPDQVMKNGIYSNVVGIMEGTFKNCTYIQSLKLSSSLKDGIGESAFEGCTNLKYVRGLDTMNPQYQFSTPIGNKAFKNCSKLTECMVAGGTLGDNAFFGCKVMTRIGGNDITSVGASCFAGCHELTTIPTLAKATTIGIQAFLDCPKLTQITWGGALTSLGREAFRNCTGLKYVYVSSPGTKALDIPIKCFQGCTSLIHFYMPNRVNVIRYNAFEDCHQLSYINFGNAQITDIQVNAFTRCYHLTTFNAHKLTTLGASAFEDCYALSHFSMDDDSPLTTIGRKAFYNAGSQVSGTCYYTMGRNVTTVEELAFANTGKLEMRTLNDQRPLAFTTVGNSAFRGSKVESFGDRLPNLTSIGESAFQGCQQLYEFTLAKRPTAIGDSAFFNCPALYVFRLTYATVNTLFSLRSNNVFSSGRGSGTTYPMQGYLVVKDASATVLSSYKSATGWKAWPKAYKVDMNIIIYNGLYYDIDEKNKTAVVFDYAFSQPTAVKIPNVVDKDKHVVRIDDKCFYKCTQITSLTLSANLSEGIGESAFFGCTNLEKVTTGEYGKVNGIGQTAFNGCFKLTECPVGGRLANHAFSNCSKLRTLHTSNDYPVTGVHASCFYHCSELTGDLGLGRADTIGAHAFDGCEKLENVVLGDRLKVIDNHAFYGCQNIKIKGAGYCPNLTVIRDEAFSGCHLIESLTCGSLTELGYRAFYQCWSLKKFETNQSSRLQIIPEEAFYEAGKNADKLFTSWGQLNPGWGTVQEVGKNAFRGSHLYYGVNLTPSIVREDAFRDCRILSEFTLNNPQRVEQRAFYNCPSLDIFKVFPPSGQFFQLPDDNVFSSGEGVSDQTRMPGLLIVMDQNETNVNRYRTGTGWRRWNHIRGWTTYDYQVTDGLIYEMGTYDSGHVLVIGYTFSEMKDVVVPSYLNGNYNFHVRDIDKDAFKGCQYLRSIAFEYGETIGDHAFEGCPNLTQVKLGNRGCSIGEAAFRNCSALTTLEGRFQDAGHYAFANCTSLTGVETLVTKDLDRDRYGRGTIGDYAFYNCKELTVQGEIAAKSVGQGAFMNCRKLTDGYISAYQTHLGDSAYAHSGIEYLRVDMDTDLEELGAYAFLDCKKLLHIMTWEGEGTSVHESAWPAKLKRIGDGCFKVCTYLSSINFEPKSLLKSIGKEAFYGCLNMKDFSLPIYVTSIGESAFEGSGINTLAFATEEFDITHRNAYSTQNHSSASKTEEHVILSSEIKSIGPRAFKDTHLTSAQLPASLETIGDQAFYNCQNLETVVVQRVNQNPITITDETFTAGKTVGGQIVKPRASLILLTQKSSYVSKYKTAVGWRNFPNAGNPLVLDGLTIECREPL